MGPFDNLSDYKAIYFPVQCILLLLHFFMPIIRNAHTEIDIQHTFVFYEYFRFWLSLVWFKEAVTKNQISKICVAFCGSGSSVGMIYYTI
jgi:hypothetical protein